MTLNWNPKAIADGDLSEQMKKLADEISILSKRLDAAETDLSSNSSSGKTENDAELADKVRSVIRSRQWRYKHFSRDLFADPAWDMLLDLFELELRQRKTSVNSLCVASQVPSTTALRWIRTLTDLGMFIRSLDPLDGRRVYVQLSRTASSAMRSYFKARP